MKNSAGQGGCYPPRLKAELDNILHILRKLNSIIALLFIQNIFKLLKEKMSFIFNNFAPSNKNNTILSPAFFGQRFNNLQRAALLTSLIQYNEVSFQIW